MKHYALSYTNLFVLHGIRRSCQRIGRKVLLYQFIRKGDKNDFNNYRGISMLSNTYRILSNILLARLTPYVDEIIGDHQCGFRRKKPTRDRIFYIRQILEKIWEYDRTVHYLFTDFKKAYVSVIEKLFTIFYLNLVHIRTIHAN
jgi:hypothetical protein